MTNLEFNNLKKGDVIISIRTKNTAIFLEIKSGAVRFEFEDRKITWAMTRFLETFGVSITKKEVEKENKTFIKENTAYYNKKNKLIKIKKQLENGRFSAWFTTLTYDKNGVSDLEGKFGNISNIDRIAY